jgi:signal transduction histidine kinase
VRGSLRNKTWLVFLVGLGSLLSLLFLPSITAIQRTDRVYRDVRRIQEAHERIERSIREIESQLYQVSIFIREFLLDSSPNAASGYRTSVADCRREIALRLAELHKAELGTAGGSALTTLEEQLTAYWAAMEPLSDWTPEERAARATYFLRQQQRPRRKNILAIANELAHFTDLAYRRQNEQIGQSERSFRDDMWRVLAFALLIGSAIAGASIFRISQLERRDSAHRRATELAEERMRFLSTQLMRAQEEERRTLSRELHDEVGQTLTALRMELGTLEGEHLPDAKELAEQALRTVRNLAVGLRPSLLDLGLVPALQSQAREISRRFPVKVTVQTSGDLEQLPEDYRTCLYRVVQESLTNVVRHARAQTAVIDVKQQGGVLELEVRDDGAGFAPEKRTPGVGVIGMQERVRELGGMVRIDSEPGRGTSVRVRLALRS